MKFNKFLAESERRSQFLATGDAFDVIVNEELAIEFDVMYHNNDTALVEADEVTLEILEHCGCSFEEDVDITTGQPILKDVAKKIKDKETQIALAKRNAPKSGLTVADVPKLEKELADLMQMDEAEYQGRDVDLNKPMRGDVKKYKVYVKNPKTGNVKKVNFGDKNMEIKRDDPARRKSFRARHGCGTPRASDRTKAAYWSCRMWSSKPVSKILKGK
jgi:cytochrome c551/c552